jgi:uncharacterized Fe-S radical SAM superfamily protein PflX
MFRKQIYPEMLCGCAREIASELKNVLPAQMKVMVAIRDEFNLGNNPDLARRQAEAQLAQATAQLDGLLAHLGAGTSGQAEQQQTYPNTAPNQ